MLQLPEFNGDVLQLPEFNGDVLQLPEFNGDVLQLPEFNGDVLQLPEFNGDVLQLRGFWDLFSSSVGDNLELSDIDKFSYLRGVLKGTALDLISGLTLSSSNYRKAV